MIPPIPRFEISPIGSMNLFGRETNLRTDSFGNLYNTLNGKTVGKIDAIGRVNTFGGEFLGFSSGLNTVRLPMDNPAKHFDYDYSPQKKSLNFEKPSFNTLEKEQPIYKNLMPKIPKIDIYEKNEPSFNLYEPKNPAYIPHKPISIERNDKYLNNPLDLNKKICLGYCSSCINRWGCSDSKY